jgi:hypothetical protein
MMAVLHGLRLLVGLLVLGGSPAVVATHAASVSVKSEESRMWMTVGERRFAITPTDSEAAGAFAAQLPLTLDMSDLNGNEKLPRPRISLDT